MTQLLPRPVLRVEPVELPPSRPLWFSCLLAMGWSAAVGLVACIAITVGVWFSGTTGSFSGAVRAGVLSWLMGNGSGILVGTTAVTAIPLGLLTVWGLLLYRGGRWAGGHSAVRSGLDIAASVSAMAVAYGGVAGVAGALAATDEAHAGPVRSVVAPGLLALVCGGIGVLRGSGVGSRLMRSLPEVVRGTLLGGLAGACTMLCAAALLFATTVVLHFDKMVSRTEDMGVDIVGGGVLVLIAVAVVPNAVLCSGAFIAGPGFMVGTGTTVAPGEISLGAIPSFPLLAALPRGSEVHWWDPLLILVPVLAGGIAAVVSLRLCPVFGLDLAALRGGLAGAAGGVLFGLSTFLATGAVGPGRMSDVGPYAAETLLVCTVAFLLGGVAAGTGTRWLQSAVARRRRVSRGDSPG